MIISNVSLFLRIQNFKSSIISRIVNQLQEIMMFIILIISKFEFLSTMKREYQKTITAFTLNYSGILDSPYQFYSNELEKQERQISHIFHQLITRLKNYQEKSFKWDIGKIDQKYQKQRYTPIYNKNAGVINGKLINKQIFEKQWNSKFSQIKDSSFSEQQISNMRLFDYMTYETLVIYSNNIENLEQFNIEQCSAQKYLALQKKYYQKSFIDEERKIDKTIKILAKRQVDIIFLQETNKNFRQAISKTEQYFVVSKQGVDSVILIRKESFKDYKEPSTINFNAPNWNQDTIWCQLGKLILASAHLSSNQKKNIEQLAIFTKDIAQIKKEHPNQHVLIGIDANSFFRLQGTPFKMFPTKQDMPTTYKQRTWMQPQIQKADILVRSCKDYLISDLNIMKCDVSLINGSNFNILIPTQGHPFDHYLVSVQVHTLL